MNIHKQRNKKAEITVETMVLIALALIFLIVVAFVLTGRISIFNKAVGDCKSKAGICTSASECTLLDGTETGFDCSDTTEICCMNTCKGAGGRCTSDTKCSNEQLYTVACENENEICCK